MAVVDAISELWRNEIDDITPLTQMDVESRILGVESADFNSVQNKHKALCGGAPRGSVSPQQHTKSRILMPMKPYRETLILNTRLIELGNAFAICGRPNAEWQTERGFSSVVLYPSKRPHYKIQKQCFQ